MDPDDALSELRQAVTRRARTLKADDAARENIYSVVRQIAPYVRQADIVRITGWTREYIRLIVKNEKESDG